MNIKPWKNHWYWAAFIVLVFIIFLALSSAKEYSIGILTSQGDISLFSIETLFRFIFNPLWVVFLWFFEKGLKLNADRHEDILKNLQGILVNTAPNGSVTFKTLHQIIYKYDDIEKDLEKRFKSTDKIKDGGGNPII